MKEPFFEQILRKRRIARLLRTCRPLVAGSRLLDIGCGWDYALLQALAPHMEFGIGIDYKVPEVSNPKFRTLPLKIDATLPFEDNTYDTVTMLAVLEHLADPQGVIREVERVLKRNGHLIITVPSKISRPVLEFLAFRLGVVNVREVRDHKQYYDYGELTRLFAPTSLRIQTHGYFQIGMNNFCVVKKEAAAESGNP